MYSPKLSYLIKLQTFYLVAILSIYILSFLRNYGVNLGNPREQADFPLWYSYLYGINHHALNKSKSV